MWNVVNSIIIVLEMILIIAGVIGLFKKKSVAGTLIFTGAVFAINMALYCIPFLYGVLVLNKEENFLFELLACLNSTMKQFAGDVKPERIAEYASVFKVYNRMFEIGTVLAVFTTVSAAIIVFGQKTVNGFRVTRRLNAHSCDIVPGHSEYALKYAKSNKNTVLVVDESVDKEYAISLMEAGYAVIRRKLNVDFLRSRYLNKKTRYHVIYVNDGKNFLEDIKMFISYLATDYDKKNVRFYVEVEEKIMETVKNKIADIGRSKKTALIRQLLRNVSHFSAKTSFLQELLWRQIR